MFALQSRGAILKHGSRYGVVREARLSIRDAIVDRDCGMIAPVLRAVPYRSCRRDAYSYCCRANPYPFLGYFLRLIPLIHVEEC